MVLWSGTSTRLYFWMKLQELLELHPFFSSTTSLHKLLHLLLQFAMAKKKRDYKAEYKKFHGTRTQKNRRNMTNKARRILGLKPGDPREVDHIIPLSKGGTNAKSNLRAVSRKTNRKKGNGIDKKLVARAKAKKKK